MGHVSNNYTMQYKQVFFQHSPFIGLRRVTFYMFMVLIMKSPKPKPIPEGF